MRGSASTARVESHLKTAPDVLLTRQAAADFLFSVAPRTQCPPQPSWPDAGQTNNVIRPKYGDTNSASFDCREWSRRVRNASHLPKIMPEGSKYVVESCGKFVRRFVELPDGTTIRLPSRKAQTCGCGDRQVSIVPDEIVDITETRIDTIV